MSTAPPDIPTDVRRWLDRQGAADRDALAQTWALAALAAPRTPSPDTEAAWERLVARLDAPRTARRSAPDRGPAAIRARRALWPALALAAVVAGAAAVGLWLRPTAVAAGSAVASVALPDGSAVTLAPGSALRYRRRLGGSVRRVRVDGQALFEVARDGRPFVAETFNAEAEVLGTTFDVSAWPAAGETTVTLVEGAVRLRGRAGAVVLAPGEASRVAGTAPPTPPGRVDVAAVTAWQTGGFAVVDAPLAAVAAAVEGRYGRPVRLGPAVDPSQRLTLFLPQAETAEAVLGDVAAYLGLRLQAGPGRYDLLTR